tara:strand:- start:2666 stop:2893 length:228 start_codon:yes stop_codon:yes gene_type:complete
MVQEITLFSRLDMSVAAGQRPVMMGVWLLAINVLLSTAMLKVLKSSSQFYGLSGASSARLVANGALVATIGDYLF